MLDAKIASLEADYAPLLKAAYKFNERFLDRLKIDQPLHRDASVALRRMECAPTPVRFETYRAAYAKLRQARRLTREADRARRAAFDAVDVYGTPLGDLRSFRRERDELVAEGIDPYAYLDAPPEDRDLRNRLRWFLELADRLRDHGYSPGGMR